MNKPTLSKYTASGNTLPKRFCSLHVTPMYTLNFEICCGWNERWSSYKETASFLRKDKTNSVAAKQILLYMAANIGDIMYRTLPLTPWGPSLPSKRREALKSAAIWDNQILLSPLQKEQPPLWHWRAHRKTQQQLIPVQPCCSDRPRDHTLVCGSRWCCHHSAQVFVCPWFWSNANFHNFAFTETSMIP